MSTSLMLAAAIFAFVTTVTPGPNNLLLAASGIQFGFRNTVPLLLGVVVGVQTLLWLIAAGLGAFIGRHELLQIGLKLFGTLYLMLLAFQLWCAASFHAEAAARRLGFSMGMMLQFVNPKAWVVCMTAISVYSTTGPDYWRSVVLISLLFAGLGGPAVTLWAAFGAGLRALIARPNILLYTRRLLAVMTGLSCVLLFI